ncbi:MAG: hypothetical protein RSA79_01155 [Oscillospiraceae bacterium]
MKHNKSTGGAVSSVMKGLAAGAVVGTAAFMMANSKKKNNTGNMKKKASKAIQAVGSAIENVSYLMK